MGKTNYIASCRRNRGISEDVQNGIQFILKICTIISGNDSIIVEIMLHCFLRWFGGGSYLYIGLSASITKAAFYSHIYKCMEAILDSDALAY
jgi:hypothetical protein